MPLALLLILVLVIVMLSMAVVSITVHFALMLLAAGFVGWGASKIVLGKMPYGWLGAILVGIAGGWIGQLLIGHVGPAIFGIRPIPALLGAIILTVIVSLLEKKSLVRRLR